MYCSDYVFDNVHVCVAVIGVVIIVAVILAVCLRSWQLRRRWRLGYDVQSTWEFRFQQQCRRLLRMTAACPCLVKTAPSMFTLACVNSSTSHSTCLQIVESYLCSSNDAVSCRPVLLCKPALAAKELAHKAFQLVSMVSHFARHGLLLLVRLLLATTTWQHSLRDLCSFMHLIIPSLPCFYVQPCCACFVIVHFPSRYAPNCGASCQQQSFGTKEKRYRKVTW